MANYRIGIDVGGTHTDAVILDEAYNVIFRNEITNFC